MKEPGRKITSLRILPPGSFFICLIWLVPLSLVPVYMLFCIKIAFLGGYHALTVLLCKSVSTTPYHVYIGMGET